MRSPPRSVKFDDDIGRLGINRHCVTLVVEGIVASNRDPMAISAVASPGSRWSTIRLRTTRPARLGSHEE